MAKSCWVEQLIFVCHPTTHHWSPALIPKSPCQNTCLLQVATVTRETGITGIMLAKDSYCIEIAGGVDRAFICLLVIAADELYHDDK